MRIKFKAGDPRAGTIAQMDSHRGQELIDTGAAVLVKEDGSDVEGADDATEAADTGDTGENTGAASAAPARKTAAKTTGKAKK